MGISGHLKSILRPIPGYALLRAALRIRTRQAIQDEILKILRPQNLFQPYSTTSVDRYASTFQFVKNNLDNQHNPNILSFGCSTGEEVFSLCRYFPDSRIKGIDINPLNIHRCRQTLKWSEHSERVSFEIAGDVKAETADQYDAIFAMAVFRHGDLSTEQETCNHLIDFIDFERTLAGLARCLKPGGLLAVSFSNFCFSDSQTSQAFTKILATNLPPEKLRYPLYDRHNKLKIGVTGDDGVYRKHCATP